MTFCALLLTLLVLCPAAASWAEEPPSLVTAIYGFRVAGISHTVTYSPGVPYSSENKPSLMVSGGRFEIMLKGAWTEIPSGYFALPLSAQPPYRLRVTATGENEAHEIELAIPTIR